MSHPDPTKTYEDDMHLDNIRNHHPLCECKACLRHYDESGMEEAVAQMEETKKKMEEGVSSDEIHEIERVREDYEADRRDADIYSNTDL